MKRLLFKTFLAVSAMLSLQAMEIKKSICELLPAEIQMAALVNLGTEDFGPSMRDLLACRRTCKMWYRLLHDRKFLESYLARLIIQKERAAHYWAKLDEDFFEFKMAWVPENLQGAHLKVMKKLLEIGLSGGKDAPETLMLKPLYLTIKDPSYSLKDLIKMILPSMSEKGVSEAVCFMLASGVVTDVSDSISKAIKNGHTEVVLLLTYKALQNPENYKKIVEEAAELGLSDVAAMLLKPIEDKKAASKQLNKK